MTAELPLPLPATLENATEPPTGPATAAPRVAKAAVAPIAATRAQPKPAPRKKAAVAPARSKPRAAATQQAAKSAEPAKAAVVSAPLPPAVSKRTTKPAFKLVRDSFTMPRLEFGLIADLKARALEFKRSTKKSELLRAGLQALAAMSNGELQVALDKLVPIQTGRPKKHV